MSCTCLTDCKNGKERRASFVGNSENYVCIKAPVQCGVVYTLTEQNRGCQTNSLLLRVKRACVLKREGGVGRVERGREGKRERGEGREGDEVQKKKITKREPDGNS